MHKCNRQAKIIPPLVRESERGREDSEGGKNSLLCVVISSAKPDFVSVFKMNLGGSVQIVGQIVLWREFQSLWRGLGNFVVPQYPIFLPEARQSWFRWWLAVLATVLR